MCNFSQGRGRNIQIVLKRRPDLRLQEWGPGGGFSSSKYLWTTPPPPPCLRGNVNHYLVNSQRLREPNENWQLAPQPSKDDKKIRNTILQL